MAMPLVDRLRCRARLDAGRRRDEGGGRSLRRCDSTTVWLGRSGLPDGRRVCSVSLSRSGLIAGAVAFAALVGLLARTRDGRAGRAWVLARPRRRRGGRHGLRELRRARAAGSAKRSTKRVGGRRAIWRDTWPMVTRLLADRRRRRRLQRGHARCISRASRLFFFNHAHDEYLQVLAEGGVLLGVPAAAALLALVGDAWRRLREDRSATYGMRAGAASGMIAAAAQGVWDVGLQMPANGVLFAILAGIVLHDSDRSTAPASIDVRDAPAGSSAR